MRGLQLIILLSTAVVLFGIAGWAMWHTWQEQELPVEEPDIRPAPISIGPDGRVFFGADEFDFAVLDEAAPDSAGLALQSALRHALGTAEDAGRASIVIIREPTTEAALVDRVRKACRAAGVTAITVRRRSEMETGGKVVGRVGERRTRLVVNLRVGGWVYVRAVELWLARRTEAERRDALLALEDTLRIEMESDPDLGAGLRAGRFPLIINTDADARPEHIEIIRKVCRERGIKRIEIKTRGP